jgi:hypothetical protein
MDCYLEAELGGSWFEASLGKKTVKPSISTNKLGMMLHACNPSISGGAGKRIKVQGKNPRPYLKNS